MKNLFRLIVVVFSVMAAIVIMGCPNAVNEDPKTAAVSRDYDSSNIGTLKYVSAGSFQRDPEISNISIISAPFRMSRHEITRQQFYNIMGSDPSETGDSSDPTATSGSTAIDDPVQNVNWYHAIAFCNKLSLAEGLTPAYSVTVSGTEVDWQNLVFVDIPTDYDSDWNSVTCDWSADAYRLPTEMEWMWAAMGAEDDYSKEFAGHDGTNSIDAYAWYYNNAADTTHPVGTKEDNELGLYDMSGNVYEWCWDLHNDYPSGEVTDYRGATLFESTFRVLRGGSWWGDALPCTVSNRDLATIYPQAQNSIFGIRVIRP